jgi:HSP20 family protein
MFFSPVVSHRAAYVPFAFNAPAWSASASCGNRSDSAEQLESTDNGYSLKLDVPGLRKEHLNIEVDGRVLRIRSQEGAPRRYHAAYRLPQALDAEATTAKLEDGVLTVALVNATPAAAAKTVTIQ